MELIMANKVGDVRPTQLLFTYGIGAVMDMPKMSGMIMGIDFWDKDKCRNINEPRLLRAVRAQLGSQVVNLKYPPILKDTNPYANTFEEASVGVPFSPFPRWMVCPQCRTLAPIDAGFFKLKTNPFKPHETCYIHENCSRSKVKAPAVLPVNFLVACENGHMNDFPWRDFVHAGPSNCDGKLELSDSGSAGGAGNVFVKCTRCEVSRPIRQAFDPKQREQSLPKCDGFHPHLGRSGDDGIHKCGLQLRAIALGASNSWFPITLSSLAIPTDAAGTELENLVDKYYEDLSKAPSKDALSYICSLGSFPDLFRAGSVDDVWNVLDKRKSRSSIIEGKIDIKRPEWEIFSNPKFNMILDDFKLNTVESPPSFKKYISRVVQVEKIREVRALIGFTRIDSPGDIIDSGEIPVERRASISRRMPEWVPAGEVLGEGIFIQFNEEQLSKWENSPAIVNYAKSAYEAHKRWRKVRTIDEESGFYGARYIFMHSLSHALMRQLSLECGYAAASIRERIYCSSEEDSEKMAGILIYTAAPDSEGTLGGLVSLGAPDELDRIIRKSLIGAELCSSDPICSEHEFIHSHLSLHGAACHSCMFSPETSCEKGNRYLDRSLLANTLSKDSLSFFSFT
jgi:hypothetical protein